jgi:hypothetical protein
MQRLTLWLVALIVFGLTSDLWAADPQQENHFATIQVDCKKIGQVHYTLQRDEQGEVETLKTRASMSILGINLYSFSQDLNEQWASGELQAMDGHTDDDGKKFTVSLARKPAEYTAVLNDKSMTIPHDAFPNSVWHYAITEQSLLFDMGWDDLEAAVRGERILLSGPSNLVGRVRQWLGLSGLAVIAKQAAADRVLRR